MARVEREQASADLAEIARLLGVRRGTAGIRGYPCPVCGVRDLGISVGDTGIIIWGCGPGRDPRDRCPPESIRDRLILDLGISAALLGPYASGSRRADQRRPQNLPPSDRRYEHLRAGLADVLARDDRSIHVLRLRLRALYEGIEIPPPDSEEFRALAVRAGAAR